MYCTPLGTSKVNCTTTTPGSYLTCSVIPFEAICSIFRPACKYRIAGKLAGIKFGDFSQNAVFLNLADFQFCNNSVPQPKDRGHGV